MRPVYALYCGVMFGGTIGSVLAYGFRFTWARVPLAPTIEKATASSIVLRESDATLNMLVPC